MNRKNQLNVHDQMSFNEGNERLPLRQPNRKVDLVLSATENIKCLPTLMVLPMTK